MQASVLEGSKRSEVSDLTFPCMGPLKTILAHTVIREGLLNFIAGGHDEGTILVNSLIEWLSRDLTRNVNGRSYRD